MGPLIDALALLFGLLAGLGATATRATNVTAAPPQSSQCDDSRWLDTSKNFCIQLPKDATHAALRVFLGSTDVSMWFQVADDGRLAYRPLAIALPDQDHELIVRAKVHGEWREIMRSPLRLLTMRGFESGQRTAEITIGLKARPGYGVSGNATPGERGRFNDVTTQAAFGFELARSGWLWSADSALVGTSYRNESLRYGVLGERAPRVDLARYQIGVTHGSTQAYLGHLSVGRHPLLVNDFNSRGFQWRQKLGALTEISFSSVNGSSIVGYDNLLGLNDSQHRLNTATAALDMVRSQPGALRIELSWLKGALRPTPDYNAGEVTDTERSEGLGIRVTSQLFADRLRTEFNFARSRYSNPFDEALAQGADLVTVEPRSARAMSADFRWEAVHRNDAADAQVMQLVLLGQIDRTDPTYRSIGSDLRADNLARQFGFEWRWRALMLAAATTRQTDNLSDIPTILKTRNATDSVNGELNLPALLGRNTSRSGWPNMTFRVIRQRQRAANAPASFQPTHLPDQWNRELALGLHASRERWEWALEFIAVDQDNRQAGRERADYRNISQDLSMRYTPDERLTLEIGASRVRNHSLEFSQIDNNHTGWLSIRWALSPRWNFSGHYSLGRRFDSLDLGSERALTLQSELTAQYDLRQFGASLPLQLFLRHSLTRGSSADRTFAVITSARDWQLTAGFNLKFR